MLKENPLEKVKQIRWGCLMESQLTMDSLYGSEEEEGREDHSQ